MKAFKSKVEFQKAVGAHIRSIRKQKRISLREFEARAEGIDRFALSRIENGETSPNVYTLYKICEAIEVRLDEFFAEI